MKIHLIKDSYSLYLDRDGVINKKKDNDYVKSWDEFIFIEGSLKAISILSNIFKKIFIVSNQRGIGRGIMTDQDIEIIHNKMICEIESKKGRIDKIYYCSDTNNSSINRKPNPGMALDSKNDFNDIEFNNSYMVGDQLSDIEFGRNLGMKTVLIGNLKTNTEDLIPDHNFLTLLDFSKNIITI
jgi:D-glycero-D-manno-heptose 1,7-bisphosphate phosphatase